MSEIDLIKLPSRFDYSCHKSFSDSYGVLLESSAVKNLILDFSQVEYIDSSALGMMVLVQKKFQGKNRVVQIKGAKGATFEILRMANMQKLFEFI